MSGERKLAVVAVGVPLAIVVAAWVLLLTLMYVTMRGERVLVLYDPVGQNGFAG
jgi:hypothetical protein